MVPISSQQGVHATFKKQVLLSRSIHHYKPKQYGGRLVLPVEACRGINHLGDIQPLQKVFISLDLFHILLS